MTTLTLTKKIGQNIRQHRLQKLVFSKRLAVKIPMTQMQLAHAIGQTGSDGGAQISRYEKNHKTPSLKTLMRLAKALGVSVEMLLN